jgi:RNA polymerase sigma factor (sigma-70 family)
VRDDPTVVALVVRASGNDPSAWNEIVERYAPLVWSICARFQLSNHDSEDVGQNVWLLLVEQLGRLREPAALPGWLATTTHRECIRVVTSARRSEQRGTRVDDALQFVDDAAVDEEMLLAERNAALRAALADLPPRCQRLLGMFFTDPPHSYAEISAELDLPIGSIGPQRARCLERLRRSPALAAFGEDDIEINIPGGEPGA